MEGRLNQVKYDLLRNQQLAKEAEQRKNDLVVYLAHDLKTPLTSVIGYLSLLRDERQISEELRRKYLSIAATKAERVEDLINEFFEITRFSLRNLTLDTARINLTRMIEQIVDEFKPLLAPKGHRVGHDHRAHREEEEPKHEQHCLKGAALPRWCQESRQCAAGSQAQEEDGLATWPIGHGAHHRSPEKGGGSERRYVLHPWCIMGRNRSCIALASISDIWTRSSVCYSSRILARTVFQGI
ncbi:MAG: hypothetical protein M0Z94_15660 [Dehalococcoidales bacterium]|nr:hypothetical protein [Dehalococcoidales bacterium]